MIILVGASASGKTEIAKILINKYKYKKIITTTTRKKRKKETDGISYHFLSKEQFLDLEKNNAFIETTLYQNEYYGTQKKDLVEKGIIILEPNGANSLVEHTNDNVFVVLIESSKNLRKRRMKDRGDSITEIEERLKKDDKLFNKKSLKKLDLLLKNKKQTLDELAKIINDNYMKKQ